MSGDFPCLDLIAVVPIFVNTGAALLPAILAGLATFISLLVKPRQLVQACRRKPRTAIGVVAGILVLAGIGLFWPQPDVAAAGRRRGAASAALPSGGYYLPVQIDWTRIALESIRGRAAGQPTSKPAAVATAPMPVATANSPFFFRGDPRRLGALGAGITGDLQKAWHYYPRWIDENGIEQIDTEAMILSSPAFHGNRVFGASCFLDPPDNFGAVFCLDAASGEQHWSIDLIHEEPMKGFFSSPAITADGRYLLIGQGLHPDTHCRLICIDTASGKIHWTIQVDLHIESSPVIADGVVFVGCGAIEDPATHKPMSHTGFVMAVRIDSGEELWRHDVADPESSPVMKGDTLYIGSGFNGNALVALNTGTDEQLTAQGTPRERWRYETDYPITGAVTLLGDLVIAGGGNGDFVFRDPNPAGIVIALDATTGEKRWEASMPDAVLGAVAAADRLVCPVANGTVIALNPQDGSQIWSESISRNAPILAAAAVTDEHIFAVSQDGYLARMQRSDGKVVEKVYINAEDRPGAQGLSISSPLVAHGRLYVGSETGGLRCYIGGRGS